MLPMGRLDCVPFVCWDRNSFHLETLFMHRGRLNSINQHSFFLLMSTNLNIIQYYIHDYLQNWRYFFIHTYI